MKQKAEEAELRRQLWKQQVRTPRRSCAALLRRLSGPPRSAWEKARLLQEEERLRKEEEKKERERERLRKEEEKAAKKAKGSDKSSYENNLRRLAAERARPGAIVPKGLFFGPVGEVLGDKVGRCCAPRSSSARVHGSSGNVFRR